MLCLIIGLPSHGPIGIVTEHGVEATPGRNVGKELSWTHSSVMFDNCTPSCGPIGIVTEHGVAATPWRNVGKELSWTHSSVMFDNCTPSCGPIGIPDLPTPKQT